MNYKAKARIAGIITAAGFGIPGYYFSDSLSRINYDIFYGNYPITQKLIAGAYVGVMGTLVSLSTVGITDGLVDIIKGTHHYVGLKCWERFTKNHKTKEEIKLELERMLAKE